MRSVVITGGTGLVGRALSRELLTRGYEVVILTRGLPGRRKAGYQDGSPALKYASWDPEKGTVDTACISAADHIIHLAGAGVARKRWSQARKREIVESRVKGGELLVNTLRNVPNQVKTVISASGIGWYGPDPMIPNPKPFIEPDPCFDDFLGNTCRAWESSISAAAELGKRTVIFRTGIVLSSSGGAIEEFKKPMRFGVAAILGRGDQVVSWIHLDDLVSLYILAIENESLRGIYNAVAPFPVSNAELTSRLARACKGRGILRMRVPAFFLKLVLGELSIEVLKSATVSSNRIGGTGFDFRFPHLEEALADICKK